MKCKICGNEKGNKKYKAKEMMLGFGDEFIYFQCANCECLQIKEIPDNLSKYYPEGYYSLQKPYSLRDNFLKAILKRQRAKYCLYGNSIVGMLLSRMSSIPNYYDWCKRSKTGFESQILDVGCGTGHLLLSMQKEGFSDLTGADPFINDNIFYDCGVRILKRDVSEIKQQFDFITLCHSFEHMPKPLSVLKELYRLLKPKKYVLIRVPVASSFAWRKYGVNWVQLDAPRHFFLHTIKSIQILADKVGFRIADTVFDSTEFQFWGSEQYLKGILLKDSNSYAENPQQSIFSKEQIQSFRAKAIELNENNDGDSACFYFYKS
jgi:SAM-dependent methyltransferase